MALGSSSAVELILLICKTMGLILAPCEDRNTLKGRVTVPEQKLTVDGNTRETKRVWENNPDVQSINL